MSLTATLLTRRTPIVARATTSHLRARLSYPPTPTFPLRTMASQTTGMLNIASEIKLDHDNVRDLFERFKAATTKDEKGIIANTLIREMAVHSDAEEVTLYNHFEKFGMGDTAHHNKEEHAEVKKLVYEADSASLDDPNYDQTMSKAVSNFLKHAEEEETSQLPLMTSKLTPDQSNDIAREFIKARGMVPSRPHPAAPQTGGVVQKAAGMQGKVHDKIIETMGRRKFKFTDVKYAHPAL
ncbi:hypothetical protein E1B28_010460 [Marasmius oreades]|uniref:Hemerythrin-like domain-containing protein n=1 Tax=Marasmius oreades TaxID=181124 RepID=A0A9P7RYM5_9AGAR|nr:uncharacterized protein E1B28_010460 [Marasmius oreades]KAG7091423.1 hypothetical protein E1B28_010460 [Marasmius oreades]